MLSPLRLLRHSSKLTGAGLVGTVLAGLASLAVIGRLGPEKYGLVAFVVLWLTYAGLAHTGVFEGGQREMIDRLGRGETERAGQVQNWAATAELASSLPALLILLGASMIFPDPIRRFGFYIAPITFAGSVCGRILSNLHYARQRFGLCARLNLLRGLFSPILLVGLVFWLGPRGYFVATALTEWLMVVLYLLTAPALQLAPAWNWREITQLVRVGLPLGLGALVYWGYRLVGQTSVAAWLPVSDLAYYGFCASLVTLALRAFTDFSGVLMTALWTEIGRHGSPQQLARETFRITVFLTLATCAVTNLAQAGFAPLVGSMLPQYVPAIPIFEILAFDIVVLTVTQVPSLVLDSAVVNKQWLHLAIWAMAVPVNWGVNYLAIRQGWGTVGVAWNDVWVQAVVVGAIYAATQRYLFETPRAVWPLVGWLVVLVGLCGLVYALLRGGGLSVVGLGNRWLEAALTIGGRVGLVAVVWGLAGIAVYGFVFRSLGGRSSQNLPERS